METYALRKVLSAWRVSLVCCLAVTSPPPAAAVVYVRQAVSVGTLL